MKRIIVLLITLSIFLSIVPFATSAETDPLLDPTLLITINGEIKQPTDVNGHPVYPILYNGTTYVPLRGLSYLFNKSVEWDSANRTAKISDTPVVAPAVKPAPMIEKKLLTGVSVDSKLKISYNGEIKQFYDVNGKEVYPILTDGTIYISLRGAANLFGKIIEWDSKNRTALINDPAISVSGVRVVVDGRVNTFDAKLFCDDWYFTPVDIKTALGVDAVATLDGYANLRTAAETMNVSYEHDSILNAAYLWTDEKYRASHENDYNRAILLGLASSALQSKPDEPITPKEFGELLEIVINKTDASEMKQFKKNVLPALSATRPMYRGEGFVMAYYAAECIGVDNRDNEFDYSIIPSDHFWDIDGCDFDPLFPYLWDGPVIWANEQGDGWQNYFVAAFFWSIWCSSPSSGIQAFEYDTLKNSMRPKELLTVREAVSAAVRMYDSYVAPAQDRSLSDAEAVSFDKTVEWDSQNRTVLVNDPAISVSGVRVVVDGRVNTFDAKLFGDNWYFTPVDIKTALGVDAVATLDGYANLRTAAKTMNVSYEHDSILNAAYLWTDEKYGVSHEKDYNRAISLGLASSTLQSKPDEPITPKEFGELLTIIINKTDALKMKQFKKNVLPALSATRPMYRGEGFVMAYYAAECIGIDNRNNEFDHSIIPSDHFWDKEGCDFDPLFPYLWDGPVIWDNGQGNGWQNYFVAAFLWSMWYSSPSSGIQVFEYDALKNSMRQKELLTVREAVSAAVRMYDSYVAPVRYVSLSDAEAVSFDKTVITDKLLNKSNDLPKITKNNMPVWKGFVLSNRGSYENRDIVESEKDLRNIANWGFNSVRIMLTYQTLFDEKAQSANLNNLKKLDALIAAAIKYNLNINLLTFSLPGRWTSTNFDTYETIGSLDLFTNPDRQKEVNAIWELLSKRYKDIPSATLSFCPMWEVQNHGLSSGLPVPSYTSEDVAKVYSQVIDTIKKYNPDRFIIFEPTAINYSGDIIKESDTIKNTIQSNYPDALMMANFCENPFVYAEMTAVAGAHIDHQNHSMFKPAYPTAIYGAQYHIDNGSPLDMNGELKAGTKIDIYLSKVDGNGMFEITADGKTLYSENLSTKYFNREDPLSWFYPYAKSDKLISVTLLSDVEKLQIRYSGNWFEWSGIDVTLPAEYAVKRWWFMSGYDAMLTGMKQLGATLKDTSTIMISPNSNNGGREITVNADVTYTTPVITAQSNKQTIENWAKEMSAYSPKLVIRFENAGFNLGCIHDSALKYYDDMLSTFDKYGFSWYSNDYWSMLRAHYYFYAGIEPVRYKDFSLDVEMLKLLQKHQ